MKVKLKFDQEAIKAFFINHGEKVAFVAFSLALLMLCWSAFNVERYTKSPDELQEQSRQANERISKSVFDPKNDNLNVLPYETLAVNQSRSLAVDPYRYGSPFHPRDFVRKIPRSDPKYLPLLELRAIAGYGPIAMPSKGGAGNRSGTGTPMGGGAGGPSMDGMGGGGMDGMSPGGMGGDMDKMKGGSQGSKGKRDKNKKRTTSRDRSKKDDNDDPFSGKSKSNPQGGDRQGRPDNYGSDQSTDEARPVLVLDNVDPKGKQWVVLTGLVPVKAQTAEYSKVYRRAAARYPDRDVPNYQYFEVERAVVDPKNPDAAPNWEKVDVDAELSQMSTWATFYPEMVPDQYLESRVCEDLPPLLGKNFDASVGHPKIPFKTDKEFARGGKNDTAPDQSTDAKGAKGNPLGRRARTGGGGNSGGGPGGGMGGGPGGGMGGGPGGGMGGGPGGGMGGGPGGGMGGAPGGGRGQNAAGNNGGGSQSAANQEKVEFRLYRFFDFSVQAGKSYRYRVRLMLANPNFGLSTTELADPKLASDEYRTTDWCEPSGKVTVTHGSQLLAGDVLPATAVKEAMARLMLLVWDPDKGVDAAKQMDSVKRGTWANFADQEVLLSSLDGRGKPSAAKIDLTTESLLVDMIGGDILPGTEKVKLPAEVLILGPDGDLTIRSQMEDASAYEDESKRLERLNLALGNDRDGKPAKKSSDKKDDSPFGGFNNNPGGGNGGGGRSGGRPKRGNN